MEREIFPYVKHANGKIAIMVELDKEAFDQLLDSYKYTWDRRWYLWLAGDNVACMQFVCQFLKVAEAFCEEEV